MKTNEAVATRIRRRREELDLTQADLGKLVHPQCKNNNSARQHIKRYESGIMPKKIVIWERLAKYLECELEWLRGPEEPGEAEKMEYYKKMLEQKESVIRNQAQIIDTLKELLELKNRPPQSRATMNGDKR